LSAMSAASLARLRHSGASSIGKQNTTSPAACATSLWLSKLLNLLPVFFRNPQAVGPDVY
jgi:hypothetical protein